MPRTRSIAHRTLSLLIGTVLAVVLLEGGLWLASLVLRPDTRASGAGGGRVLLCVGDSNTYGIRLAEEASYPGQLQSMLDTVEGEGAWRVVNRGYPGWNSAEIRLEVADRLPELRPAAVVLWAGVNNRWSPVQSHLWDEPDREPGRGLLRTLVQESRTLHLLRILAAGSQEVSAGAATDERFASVDEHHVPEAATGSGPVRTGEELARTIRVDFHRILDLSREHGARVVTVNYPLRGRPIREDLNPAIEAFSASAGVPLVDLFGAIDPLVDMLGKQALFQEDGTHLNEIGNYETARRILVALADAGLLEDPEQAARLPTLEERLRSIDVTARSTEEGIDVEIVGPPGWRYRLVLIGRYRTGDERITRVRHEDLAPFGVDEPSAWRGFVGEDGRDRTRIRLPEQLPPDAEARWLGWELLAEAKDLDGGPWDIGAVPFEPAD